MNQGASLGWTLFGETIRLPQQILRVAEPAVRVEMNRAQRFTLLNLIAYLLVQDEADCRVDDVFLLFAAAAED